MTRHRSVPPLPLLALLLALLLCLPVTAQTPVPHAPTTGDALPPAIVGEAGELMGTRLAYFEGDAEASGYLSVPAGDGPFPSVILIHEWNGLVERVQQTADSFAAEGYVALAVDLYSGRTGTNPQENMALVRETLADEAKLIANLDAAVAYLRGRDDTTDKVATIGWCYGGGVALSFALGGEHHDGTAIFYGRLLADPEQMKTIDHPVYGTFVENDRGIPVEDVERFVETLRAAGIANDVHIYDEVAHGFWLHVDRDPEKNTPAAIDAWKRLRTYLQSVLGG
ncbi:MAG: dienelactone hydrolase family protein [Acidobacteria bacterium]|nr:MAG: dienelactone hydrolase family protein [Acidobacteriota bacterium]